MKLVMSRLRDSLVKTFRRLLRDLQKLATFFLIGILNVI